MIMTENTNFLTPEEMATKLRISIRKLQMMMKEGTAPEYIKLGSRVLFVVERVAQ
jgi:predicted DNA-binding transcriptional regulator AlpA